MKPSTFFSVALALIAGVSAHPLETSALPGVSTLVSTPTLPSTSFTVTMPKRTPNPGIGLPAIPSPINTPVIGSRGTECSGSKTFACCDEVEGLCNVLVGGRTCPSGSMYCCDFSGNVSNFRLLLDFSSLPYCLGLRS